MTEVHAAPGNPGMLNTTCHSVSIVSGADVVALARKIDASLVVIGPEVPLVAGVADALRAADIPVFGPSAQAALIEGSKAFAKDVMASAGVRTARAEVVESLADLDDALDRFGPRWVVKDDGLAAGKGVVVTDDRDEARSHAASCLNDGSPVLLESFLDGPEVSLFCLVDGDTVIPLIPAQDHKRVGTGDVGPNTGGMGAYCPLPWLPETMVDRIVDEVCRPVAVEMVNRGCGFSGLLYAGLAITSEGPSVVEFNCRFGDPETQAVLSLLKSPLGETLLAVATGSLADLAPLEWEDGYAVTVVLAAEHYPSTPRTGDEIDGSMDPRIRHAGTALVDGKLVSAGGRVLAAVGKGASLSTAREEAYEVLDTVSLPGSHFRTDIGFSAEKGNISIPR